MKIKQLIFEGLSPILFHRTSTFYGTQIIDENRFRLVSPMGTSVEREITKKLFYLSTTRSLSGYYQRDHESNACYFVLDGKALMADGYSGSPIDYWSGFPRGERDELEDRVFSNKPEITNANRYILEMNILFNPDEKPSVRLEAEKSNIRKCIINCKKRNIPIYLYTALNDYNTRNKAKAVSDFSILKRDNSVSIPKTPVWKKTNFLAPYVELLKAPIGTKLSKEGKRIKDNIVWYSWHQDEHVRSLDNTIHNDKTEDKTNQFILLCRSMKLYTTKDVIQYIHDKYKD